MKFTVERALFEEAAFLAQTVAERKTTLPILANALVRASGGKVELLATDYEVAVKTQVDAKVTTEGEITLPAKKMYEMARHGSATELTIDTDKNFHATLKVGTRYKLHGVNPEEFPKIPSFDVSAWITLDAARLKDVIKNTIFAAAQSEARLNLSGVYVEAVDDKTLRFVATDGHRMVYMNEPAAGKVQGNFKTGMILPRRGLQELSRVLPSSGEISIGVKERYVIVRWENREMLLRQVEAEFPRYQEVIPEKLEYDAYVERPALLSAINRVALLTNDRYVGVQFTVSKGELKLYCQNPELGEGEETVSIEYKGPDIAVGFNVRYLLEALNAIATDNVRIRLTNEVSPAVVQDAENAAVFHIVMPMRI